MVHLPKHTVEENTPVGGLFICKVNILRQIWGLSVNKKRDYTLQEKEKWTINEEIGTLILSKMCPLRIRKWQCDLRLSAELSNSHFFFSSLLLPLIDTYWFHIRFLVTRKERISWVHFILLVFVSKWQ